MKWHYNKGGQSFGPVEEDELARMAADGRLLPDDLVWNSNIGKQWARASSIPSLFPPTAAAPRRQTVTAASVAAAAAPGGAKASMDAAIAEEMAEVPAMRERGIPIEAIRIEIERALADRGVDPGLASMIAGGIPEDDPDATDGTKQKIWSALLIVAGFAISALSYAVANPGGVYVVTTAPIIVGIVLFVKAFSAPDDRALKTARAGLFVTLAVGALIAAGGALYAGGTRRGHPLPPVDQVTEMLYSKDPLSGDSALVPIPVEQHYPELRTALEDAERTSPMLNDEPSVIVVIKTETGKEIRVAITMFGFAIIDGKCYGTPDGGMGLRAFASL